MPAGQAEAARALGMTFRQTLRTIVLPQAFRTVIAPLGNVLIALTKNTAIADAFGVIEATGTFDNLVRDYPGSFWALFLGIAAGYVVIVLADLGGAAAGRARGRWCCGDASSTTCPGRGRSGGR